MKPKKKQRVDIAEEMIKLHNLQNRSVLFFLDSSYYYSCPDIHMAILPWAKKSLIIIEESNRQHCFFPEPDACFLKSWPKEGQKRKIYHNPRRMLT